MQRFAAIILVLAFVTFSQAFFLNPGHQGANPGTTTGGAPSNQNNNLANYLMLMSGNDMLQRMFAFQSLGPLGFYLFN